MSGRAWTREDAERLQALTRQIIAEDGNDLAIGQMAYAAAVRDRARRVPVLRPGEEYCPVAESGKAYAAPDGMLKSLAGLYGGGGMVASRWFSAREAARFLGLEGDYRHRVWVEERLRVVAASGRVVFEGIRCLKLLSVCVDGGHRFLWVESPGQGDRTHGSDMAYTRVAVTAPRVPNDAKGGEA